MAAGAGYLDPKVNDRWTVECPPCRSGELPPAVAPVPSVTYQLTEEQEAVVVSFQEGLDLAVQAGAGTGKTSLLLALGESTKRHGQYLAFNSKIVEDAAAKFAASSAHVNCSTINSVAFKVTGKPFSHRLNADRISSREIAHRLHLDPVYVKIGEDTKVLEPAQLAGHIFKAVTTFCNSADLKPATKHFPYIDGIDPVDEDGKRTFTNNKIVHKALLPALKVAWLDLQDPNGQLRFTHDVYVKLFELSDECVIPADFILVDEAQDLNPVLISILNKQHVQIVVVGDSQQAIYGWRGAIDALETFPAERTHYLTHSFRFGQGIADVANQILASIESAQLRLIGRGEESVVGISDTPNAILTRTNAGAIGAVLSAIESGRKPFLVGGGQEVESFTKAVRDLKVGKRTTHPDLVNFSSWAEVQDSVEDDPAYEDLKLLVKLIDNHGIAKILEAVANVTPEESADVVVCTAHKSKGLQWDTVQIAPDFPSDRESDEEKRLLYVAITRAQRHLDYTACFPVRQILGEVDDNER